MDSGSKRPGSITSLLVGIVLLITIGGVGAMLYPSATCPKCEGRGLHRMIDAQGPPDIRGVSFRRETCNFCSDRRMVSFLKRSQWRPEDAPVHPVYRN
jgi:hypothetical protein